MRVLLILAIAFVTAAGPTAAQSDSASQVDTLLSRLVPPNSPGAAVSIVQRGRILYQKGYGVADMVSHEPITWRSVFDLASVSKPLTAIAVLTLVEAGELQYTDALSQFFPDLPAGLRPITIRQLLTHTSGLMDYTTVWGETRPLKDGSPRTAENVVKFLSTQPLRFPPGQRWEYSNSNYVVLAQIIGKVSGQRFPVFMREHVFAPFGMTSSFVYETGRSAGRVTGYTSRNNTFTRAPRNSANEVYGDGQVNSTLADLSKWATALTGSTSLNAALISEASTPARTSDGTPVTYGLGWGLGRYRGLDYIGHGGETDGFVAQVTRFPKQDLTVIVLSNNEQFPSPFAVANKIAGFFLAAELKPPAVVQISPDRLKDCAGTYGLYDLVLKIQNEEGSLWLAPQGQTRQKLLPVSDDEFVVEGTDGASGIRFARNAQRVVTALSLLDQNGTMLWKRGAGPRP